MIATRFAPSPTGYLHIGGARTALFNWIYARREGGRFFLRIEDTDAQRHKEEALSTLINELRWLGLEWDGEPILQSRRRTRHSRVAEQLVEKGAAFRCFLTKTELAEARERAQTSGTRFVSPWREKQREPSSDIPHVIRLKTPLDAPTSLQDIVQGSVTVRAAAMDDPVLLRADGTPTYILAAAVDDHDMGITHVIRGDDHLVNALRQSHIFTAMGWKTPAFAHLPLIHNASGQKLSKRHDAVSLSDFRNAGLLPAALRNYLLRLGWGHENLEILSDAQARSLFTLEAVKKAPSRLDIKRLRAMNKHYIQHSTPSCLLGHLSPFLRQHVKEAALQSQKDALLRLLAHPAAGVADLKILCQHCLFLFEEANEEAAEAPPIDLSSVRLLRDLCTQTPDAFTHSDAVSLLRLYEKKSETTIREYGRWLRWLLTRQRRGADLASILFALGKKRVIARLDLYC